MRLIEIPLKNYDALIHDIIKNSVVLLTVEGLQTLILGQKLFDRVFSRILLYTMIGNLIFYLIVDRYLFGAGPILSGDDD